MKNKLRRLSKLELCAFRSGCNEGNEINLMNIEGRRGGEKFYAKC